MSRPPSRPTTRVRRPPAPRSRAPHVKAAASAPAGLWAPSITTSGPWPITSSRPGTLSPTKACSTISGFDRPPEERLDSRRYRRWPPLSAWCAPWAATKTCSIGPSGVCRSPSTPARPGSATSTSGSPGPPRRRRVAWSTSTPRSAPTSRCTSRCTAPTRPTTPPSPWPRSRPSSVAPSTTTSSSRPSPGSPCRAGWRWWATARWSSSTAPTTRRRRGGGHHPGAPTSRCRPADARGRHARGQGHHRDARGARPGALRPGRHVHRAVAARRTLDRDGRGGRRPGANVEVGDPVGDAVDHALAMTGEEDLVLISGSLYVVGEARTHLRRARRTRINAGGVTTTRAVRPALDRETGTRLIGRRRRRGRGRRCRSRAGRTRASRSRAPGSR